MKLKTNVRFINEIISYQHLNEKWKEAVHPTWISDLNLSLNDAKLELEYISSEHDILLLNFGWLTTPQNYTARKENLSRLVFNEIERLKPLHDNDIELIMTIAKSYHLSILKKLNNAEFTFHIPVLDAILKETRGHLLFMDQYQRMNEVVSKHQLDHQMNPNDFIFPFQQYEIDGRTFNLPDYILDRLFMKSGYYAKQVDKEKLERFKRILIQ